METREQIGERFPLLRQAGGGGSDPEATAEWTTVLFDSTALSRTEQVPKQPVPLFLFFVCGWHECSRFFFLRGQKIQAFGFLIDECRLAFILSALKYDTQLMTDR